MSQKPLTLENKINKVSNLVQKFNDGELSYQGLDNELDELYAQPSKGMVEKEVIDKIISHEITNEKVDQMIEDISIHGKYVTKDGERIDPNDMYKDSTKEGSADCTMGNPVNDCKGCPDCMGIIDTQEFSGYQTETPKEGSSTWGSIKGIGIDLIEEYFPKGQCKERGQAMTLYARLIVRFHAKLSANAGLVELDDIIKDAINDLDKNSWNATDDVENNIKVCSLNNALSWLSKCSRLGAPPSRVPSVEAIKSELDYFNLEENGFHTIVIATAIRQLLLKGREQ